MNRFLKRNTGFDEFGIILFESLGCRKDLYTRRTVHSIVHKVTVDVIKAFKDEKIKRIKRH